MAKEDDESPGGADSLALELLRRSAASATTARQASAQAAPVSRSSFRARARARSAAAKENSVPDPLETVESPGSESAAATPGAMAATPGDTDADDKRHRRWIVLVLLLISVAGGVAALLWPDGEPDADKVAEARFAGPIVSQDGQASAADERQQRNDNSGPPNRAERLPGATETAGRDPRAESFIRRPSDGSSFVGTSGLPQSSEPSFRDPLPPDRAAPASPAFRQDGNSAGFAPADGGARARQNPAARLGSPGSTGTPTGTPGSADSATGTGSVARVSPPPAVSVRIPPPPGTSAEPGSADERMARLLDSAAPEDCPPDSPMEPTVLVFDGSVSMSLPVDMPVQIESELDRRIDSGDEAARLEYRRWIASDQPKRIDLAKNAVATMLDEAHASMKIGAVAFTACREVKSHVTIGFAERSSVREFINAVTPHRGGDTALVASLEAAFGLLDGNGNTGRGRIILLTDGRETCGGNLCALARDMETNRPGIRVDVIDLSGTSNTACLTEATGGLLLTYDRVRQMPLGKLLTRAANQCPIPASRQTGP